MPKTRVPIPKHVREQVLAEFHHRCAICAADRPHLHHIDENPANNDVQNLLPLCPNCHLVDQHNPTAPVDPLKLGLFRRFKDPVILSPQFHPLFRRLTYLFTITPSARSEDMAAAGAELVAFVNALNMGGFYHTQIVDLVMHSSAGVYFTDEPDHVTRERFEQRRRVFHNKLLANRDRVVDLIVEMLRYQDWPSPTRGHTRPERAT
jgi:hypothetical protein